MNYYKARQYSDQRKKNKKTNNGQQNKIQKNIN